MTEQQLYFAIGLPVLVALTGILTNLTLFLYLGNRISRLEDRTNAKFEQADRKLETAVERLEAKLDILTGKVIEIDNRVARMGG